MTEDAQVVLETEWFSIEREHFDDVASLDGKPFYRLRSPDGVIVLALTEAGQIVLVRQFRPAIREQTLELPSGAVDGGESPGQAAARELYEETGFRCRALEPLGAGRVMIDRSSALQHAFLGRDAVRDPAFVRREETEVVLVTTGRFRTMVVSGELQQFAALATVVLADWKTGTALVGG